MTQLFKVLAVGYPYKMYFSSSSSRTSGMHLWQVIRIVPIKRIRPHTSRHIAIFTNIEHFIEIYI